MKKVISLLSIILFMSIGSSFAQHQSPPESGGIEFFEGSWDETLALAKKENKPIFLDVYASWCGPCKLLKKNSFPDGEVGKYFNKNYINVTLDGEKGDGIKVARELKANSYPSLYILNLEGEAIVYYTGYLEPADLIELGKAGLGQLK